MSISLPLKAARTLSLATGLGFAFLGQTQLFGTLLTGQGTSVDMLGSTVHAAAVTQAAQVSSGPTNFVIGIAFIMVGFLLHALIGTHEEDHERQVHITVAPKKHQKRWFWIEMRI